MIGRHQQRAAVAFGQPAFDEQLEHLVREVEQAQQVRDGDARAADALADLLAGEPELVDEQRAGASLLDRVEVLARHVLDQRELERLAVLVRRDDGRNHFEAGQLSGAPAALAGDQLVGAAGQGRTSTGWITPRSRTDSDSASSASSSKR